MSAEKVQGLPISTSGAHLQAQREGGRGRGRRADGACRPTSCARRARLAARRPCRAGSLWRACKLPSSPAAPSQGFLKPARGARTAPPHRPPFGPPVPVSPCKGAHNPAPIGYGLRECLAQADLPEEKRGGTLVWGSAAAQQAQRGATPARRLGAPCAAGGSSERATVPAMHRKEARLNRTHVSQLGGQVPCEQHIGGLRRQRRVWQGERAPGLPAPAGANGAARSAPAAPPCPGGPVMPARQQVPTLMSKCMTRLL